MGDRFLVIHSDYIDGDNDGPYRDGRPGDIIISADQLRVMDGGVLDAYLQLAHDGYQVTIESSSGPILIDGVELGDHVDRHLGNGSDSLYAVAVDAPNALDDANDGYGIGSRWINVTDGYEYVCIDATAGAAVWKNTTLAGAGGAGVDVKDVKVSADDAVPGFLEEKIVDGYGIDLAVLSDGADEQLQISLVSPTAVGQVLFSKDGYNFTVEQPLISRHGWLVNDSCVLIVVG